MVNPSSPQHNKGSGANAAAPNAEAELLQSVLSAEAYPWSMDKAETYEEGVEAAGQALEISDEEAAQGWQRLSAHLDQALVDPASINQTQSAEAGQSALFRVFAERIPADMLTQIAQKAGQISKNGESMVNQMVACAQEIMSELAETDLQVIARPMALAMRGRSNDEIVDATVKSVRAADWDALSPIEQAKLSLAAARYALTEVDGPSLG